MLWGNRLYRMFIKPTKFHNTALLFGSSMARFVSRCKITTFPQTRKGMEKILLQRIVFGCFLHELPLMYHELPLIVCFTRIAINVPRIVINCFGVLYQGADVSNSHVLPTQTGAVAGIYGCGIQESALLNIKTRHCISGCGGAVPSGLRCTTPHSHLMTTPTPLAVIADLNRNPLSGKGHF